ncbi:G-type lectin S-receptor-like serine/threonine-protein kinase At1g34300 [Rhododendron vialii]|uniref:G-type lectin S-receptor-like serine/threonine-protein kinase At1g34300 n=1 Tax=Rhododendron vialii TaxID=182163 RepID=UPI00265E8A95|nr:G-type lectin S-receptor-like serine/threonine-protein kinase At1g34300 [Rhododendron vialii]
MGVPFALMLTLLFSSVFSTDISPGSTLYASDPTQTWTSPMKNFSLGFISDGFAHFAAVTYNGIAVWKAGGSDDGGGAADSSASLRFLANGNLRLVNGSSGSVVWQSNTADRGIISASLDDSGNFVLKNSAVSIWSTFNSPTDTILPSQNFTINQVLRSGLYSFSLLTSGNLALRWNDSILYWSLGSDLSHNNINITSPSLRLESNGTVSISDPSLSNTSVMAYSSDYAEGGDILRFLRLDSDGNLRIYSSAKGSGKITERWAAVPNLCLVFGYCGDMGICSYSDTGPICGCPSLNFDPIDPNNRRKGCRRRVEIEDCPGRETMLQLDHAMFLTYPPELVPQHFTGGIAECRSNCLNSRSCIASTSLADGQGSIYMKFPGFLSGYQSPALRTTSFLKVCDPIIPNPSISRKNARGYHAWVVVLVVLGTIFGFVVLEGVFLLWLRGKSQLFGGLSSQHSLLDFVSGVSLQFSYKELRSATKGFKYKVGGGEFGAVFVGTLANGTVVAVKRLEGIEQGEKLFRMEVATISNTHHLNLVRLIGFCCEGHHHRLLVYEYMQNRSLDHFLFPREEFFEKSLSWECRFTIALGTAKGIVYLHEECRDCIVHCNLKPENILLDEKYTAKVSDFGLAKIASPKKDHHRHRTLANVRGNTRGYFAPELVANLSVTSKADVYCYGMVLLEIVSGRRSFEVSIETDEKKFSVWAYERFEKGNVKGIVDKGMVDHEEVDMSQVMRAIQVAFWCIQEQPSQRPTMGEVVQMLEGITKIRKPPNPKAVGEGAFDEDVGGGNVSGFSNFVDSTMAPSPSSSFQTSSFHLERNLERASSSLLHLEH